MLPQSQQLNKGTLLLLCAPQEGPWSKKAGERAARSSFSLQLKVWAHFAASTSALRKCSQVPLPEQSPIGCPGARAALLPVLHCSLLQSPAVPSPGEGTGACPGVSVPPQQRWGETGCRYLRLLGARPGPAVPCHRAARSGFAQQPRHARRTRGGGSCLSATGAAAGHAGGPGGGIWDSREQ